MPIYEFVCPKCGNKIEVITGKAEAKCECGQKMKLTVSAPAFRIYTKV